MRGALFALVLFGALLAVFGPFFLGDTRRTKGVRFPAGASWVERQEFLADRRTRITRQTNGLISLGCCIVVEWFLPPL